MRDLRDAPAPDHAKAKHRVTAEHAISHGAPAIRRAARAISAAPRAAATRHTRPEPDRHRIADGRQRPAPAQLGHRRLDDEVARRFGEAARQHDEIRVDDRGDPADRTTDGPTRGGEDVDGVAVVGTSRGHDFGRCDRAAEPALCGLRHGAAAGVQLEASDAAAGAPRALGLDLEMAELAAQTAGADQQLPVDDDSAADAGAKRDGDQRSGALPGAADVLGVRGRVAVVLEEHRHAEAFCQQLSRTARR